MSTFDQIRRGLGQAWDNVAEGWHQLRERAAQALTRFSPVRHGGELETVEDQVARQGAHWSLLAAEVEEQDKDVVVRLEVPGMESDDFDIAVIDDHLIVRGEKRVQREQQRGRYYVMECAYGSFERALPLPAPVEESKARANYRRGVLTITLPKRQSSARRRINVEVH